MTLPRLDRLLDLLTRCLDWFSLRCTMRRQMTAQQLERAQKANPAFMAERCIKGPLHRGPHRYRRTDKPSRAAPDTAS